MNNKGFSLVEVMVTFFIFALLGSGLYGVMVAGDQFWRTNQSQIELHQELRKAVDWMKDDLRQASDSSITDCAVGASTCATITFKKPTGVTGGAIVWDSNSTNFAISGTQLVRTYNSIAKVLANDISGLNFDHSTAGEIIITIQGQQNAVQQGETIDYSLDYRIQLRN